MAGTKNEKIDLYDFPVHDCANGSPCFSSIVRQCQWPSLSRKTVEISKFCYHGHMTSHFSSLLTSQDKLPVSQSSEPIRILKKYKLAVSGAGKSARTRYDY